MSKSSNFFGQPIYGQLIKTLDREKIVEISRKHGGEKYALSYFCLVSIQDKLILAEFVRRGVWWRMLKIGYYFDNREIMTNIALSHFCRFGN